MAQPLLSRLPDHILVGSCATEMLGGESMMQLKPVFVALVLAVGIMACAESPTEPTPPPGTVTDTFSGELSQGTEAVHPFPVSTRAMISVKLTEVAPLATLALGLGVGIWDGTDCALIAWDPNARVGSELTGAVDVGSYCAYIADVGNIAEPISYTVTALRP
jgi:hypothetical protein